ncbi:MAG: DUF1080 domain-containing protein [Opitutaceae bacterium]|nr:DUF1080 domain-containing protein [Opitutaceae bacterium]
MKNIPMLGRVVLLASFALMFAPFARAAEGWRELFNGKDLTGWRANAYPDSWSVVDGTIRAHATKESSHLFFVGDGKNDKNDFVRFKNFELEFTTRGEPNANSGVFIHTDLAAGGAALRLSNGYEIQLNSTEKEKRKTGSLYDVVDLATSPVDETKWFAVRITVKDRRITIQVGGKTTVDYTEPDNVQRAPARKGRRLNPLGGAIALQAHDPKSVFYFKSVRIRELN